MRRYAGILRLALLLWPTVVVPDSVVLDGRFFLSTGPDALLTLLAQNERSRRLPIEIASRAKSLEDALINLLIHRNGTELKAFRFAALPQEMADVLFMRIPQKRLADLRTAIENAGKLGGLVAFLKHILLDEGSFRAKHVEQRLHVLERQWRAWIDAQRRGMLRMSEWPGCDPDFGKAFHDWEPSERLNALSHHAAKAAEAISALYPRHGLVDPPSRSAAYLELKKWNLAHREHAAVKSWLDRCYHRALAFQHGAQFIEIETQARRTSAWRRMTRMIAGEIAAIRDYFTGSAQPGRTEPLRLPPEVLASLGVMPPAAYERVRYRSRDARERLRQIWKDESHNETAGRRGAAAYLSLEARYRWRRWLQIQSIKILLLHEIEQPNAAAQLADGAARISIVLLFSALGTIITGQVEWFRNFWALLGFGIVLLLANCLDQVRLFWTAFGESVEGTIALPRKISR